MSVAGGRACAPFLVWIGCHALMLSACSFGPDPHSIAMGDTRDSILQQYGEPAKRQELIKHNEHILGPVESFWYEVPMDSRIEIWSYRVKHGYVELYFVDGSSEVQGIGFNDLRAVY